MSEVRVHTELINDIPLLVHQQKRMGIAEIVDDIVARHGNRIGLSLGWMIVGWLSYITRQLFKMPIAKWVGAGMCPMPQRHASL